MFSPSRGDGYTWYPKRQCSRLVRILQGIGLVFASVIAAILLLDVARDLYARYMPLPAIPRSSQPSYTLQNTNQVLDRETVLDPISMSYLYCRLTDTGKIEYSKEGDFESPYSGDGKIYGIAPVSQGYQLYKHTQLIDTTPYGVRGYWWSGYYHTRFSKTNRYGIVIGNTCITTGHVSHIHPFAGHMRPIPLVWRRNASADDLNALVAASGWYITHTVDINDQGQILCAAQQTDAKGAEYGAWTRPYHLLILTPIARSQSQGAIQ